MIAPQYPFREFKHEFHTIQELIDWAGHTYHDHDAFRFYQGVQIVSKTYGEFLLDVQCAGRFFATCCSPQDHIAIIGNTSYLWMVAWAGAVSAGFVAVPVDRLLSEDDIAFLLKQADVSVLVFDASCAGMIAAMQDKCPQINYICMNGQNLGNMSFDLGIQEQKNAEKPTWINKVLPQDVAEIVFTSGTTGSYKGCVLTHDNLAWNAMNGSSYVALTPEKKTLSILPIHHTLEITAGMLTPFCSGVTICINDSLRNIQRNLNVFHPECMIAVPMVVEMLYKSIWIAAKRSGKEKVLHMALKLSKFLQRLHIHIERKLFSTVLKELGGKLELLVVGGAYLKPSLVTDFSAMGITIVQGYGVTECGPVVACNTDRKWKADSVGQVVTGCKVKIAAGEIWVSGPIVMRGYYNDEASNREAFDGVWYKTGDLGRLDKNGYLYITGRKKNLIILSNGENVSPEELELRMMQIEGVSEVVVYAKENILTAEIFPEKNADPSKIKEGITALNRSLPEYKKVRKVIIRNEPFPKTTTQKIKRKN